MFSTTSFNELFLRSRHLRLDTNPTLLLCNDSFVHRSRRLDPTKKFVRRHQRDLTSAQVRTSADFCVSPLAGYSSATFGSEDADALGASCSNRTFFLNLSVCSSRAANLNVSHSSLFVLVLCDVSARCVRMSNRHLLIISVPGSKGTSPAPFSIRALFLSFTQSVSAILSLYVSILACPVKVLSIIVPARFRDVSYVVFVAFPCDASNAYPGLRELQHPKTKRRIFCAQPPEIFRPQFLAIEVPFLLRQR